jgi:HlyD family secretion protein
MRKALAVALVSLALVGGCGHGAHRPDGSGTIESTDVLVAPEVAGEIVELPPQEGDALAKDDLVARIDDEDYVHRRDQARAALALAQAQLDLTIAGARDEDIQAARDQVRQARASSDLAESNRGRIERLFGKGSTTQQQLDEARAAAERAAAALSSAEEMLAKLLRGSREEEVRIAQASVDQARAQLALAESALDDCTVKAPIAGVVTTRIREVGEFVGAGAPLVALSKLDQVWLSIYVAESRLAGVKLGQPAYVKVDGDPTYYEGKVTFVSPEAEFTPRDVQTPSERTKLVYRVKISLPNPNGVFKPGMPADGYLEAPK